MRLAISFLFVVTWTCGHCAGFDYASSCTRADRSNRARSLPDAPCDLTKLNFCTTPGTGYPWNAIRRFVRENQGLMRRMYGEERHISILKAELENYIEDDDEDELKRREFTEDIVKAKMMYTKLNNGRAMKDRPHFRPIQTEKIKKNDETLKVKPLENRSNVTKYKNDNKTEISNETTNKDNGLSYKTKLESIANIEINNLEPDVITLEAVIKQSIETNSIYPKSSNGKIDALEENNNTQTGRNMTTTTEDVNGTDTTTDGSAYSTTEADKDIWKPINFNASTIPPTLLFSDQDKVKDDKADNKGNDNKEEFHPKPIQHQDTGRPSVIKLGGANACESKDSLTAPFWANSTRGEVLALLNMYPFEQFIHLETCVQEKKQMYCREGCRCEQQYRLHRLLAYDPRNECRGIFADWFKFPACCVCKCYDVPLEFRARSPRILHPQYDEAVKRVIYDDVARDWYSMSVYDDDDLF